MLGTLKFYYKFIDGFLILQRVYEMSYKYKLMFYMKINSVPHE